MILVFGVPEQALANRRGRPGSHGTGRHLGQTIINGELRINYVLLWRAPGCPGASITARSQLLVFPGTPPLTCTYSADPGVAAPT